VLYLIGGATSFAPTTTLGNVVLGTGLTTGTIEFKPGTASVTSMVSMSASTFSVTAGSFSVATTSSATISATTQVSMDSANVFVTASTGMFITAGASGVFITGGLRINGGVYITGGITLSGSITAGSSTITTSDRRLKTNIKPIDNALSKVSKLNGVYFNWIQDEPTGLQFDEKRHVGVLAQEVEQVLPEVVQYFKGGRYLGVDYPSIIPLLIEAIHELNVDDLDDSAVTELHRLIELLQLRMLTLENTVESLQAKVDKLVKGV